MYPSLISAQISHKLHREIGAQNELSVKPAPMNNYFETEEEEASFDEANFDAPVPEYYLREMSGVPEETAAAEVPTPVNLDPNSRNAVTKYSESFKVKYKTEMCKNWENTGHCEF